MQTCFPWQYKYTLHDNITSRMTKNAVIHNNLSEPVQKKSFSVEIRDMKQSNVSNNINMFSHQFTPYLPPYLPTNIFSFFSLEINKEERILKTPSFATKRELFSPIRERLDLLFYLQNYNDSFL